MSSYTGLSRRWLKGACEACGGLERLEAHHIDENPKNNRSQNIQTLCRSCHRAEHAQRRSARLEARLDKWRSDASRVVIDLLGAKILKIASGFRSTFLSQV